MWCKWLEQLHMFMM